MRKIFYVLFCLIFLIGVSKFNSQNLKEDMRHTNSPFGMLSFTTWNHDWNHYHYSDFNDVKLSIQLMKEAGVGIVRLDFAWFDIEPEKDKFVFEKHNNIVDELIKNDIKILGMLHYNPYWSDQKWNDPPEESPFLRYVQKTVMEFKDRVGYWEVWNEPNHSDYWSKQDKMKSYTDLLKVTYQTIKQEDPTSKVLIGGLTADIETALSQVYQNGAKDYFDILNIHPFQNPKNENAFLDLKIQYSNVKNIMEKYDDSQKRIWITEIGCPSAGPDSKKHWWFGESTDEVEQAKWLELLYTEILSWDGIDKVFWAFFRDTHHFYDTTDTLGLITKDFEKKPSYYSYQRISSQQ